MSKKLDEMSIEELREELGKARSDLEAGTKKVTELETQLATAKAEVDKLKGENAETAQLREELERAKQSLSAANSESAGRRKKIEELEGQLTDARKEATDAKATNEQLILERNAEKLEIALTEAAREAGFKNPQDAIALLDISDVEMTDEGLKGHEDGLKALVESGRLPMAGDSQDKRLGTPPARGNKPSGTPPSPQEGQEAPNLRF